MKIPPKLYFEPVVRTPPSVSLTCYHGMVVVVSIVTVQNVVGCPDLNIKYEMFYIIILLYHCVIVPAVLHPAPDEELIVDSEQDSPPANARDEEELAPGEGVVRHLSVRTED